MALKQTKVFHVAAHDGYQLEVKIDFPPNSKSIAVFCQGSGPNTYDNHRELNGRHFNYFDLFADECCRRGIAFCRWNTRGCSLSDCASDFVAVNEAEFSTYCPETSVQDILTVKRFVKAIPAFQHSKVLLMGMSEGASLIPFAAEKCRDVAGLLLLSFSCRNMKEILDWQLSGGSSMVNMCRYFGCPQKGVLERDDFLADVFHVRSALFPDTAFEDLDADGDGRITQADFAIRLADYKRKVFQAIEAGDDQWLKENYPVRATSCWFRQHFALPDIAAALCTVTAPVYIFRGDDDANIPADDIDKLRKAASAAGRDNLHILTFPGHDHDLNYLQYIVNGTIPDGLQRVFDIAQAL